MELDTKIKGLKIALVIIGLIFIFLLTPLVYVLKTGWQWKPPQYEYEQMILGIYATLGVFLLIAAYNPWRHLSLIWFTVWSSIIHGGIMAIQAFYDPLETPHLYGDVPALLLVALVLAVLTPRQKHVDTKPKVE